MERTIIWLNTNQGFVMCLLTFVYVVATIVIMYYNKKSINEMAKSREEDSRPYVFANLERDPRDRSFTFKVKNHGKSSAKIIRMEINPNIKFIHEKDASFLSGVIISPGQVIPFLIPKESKEMMDCLYKILIDYESLAGKKYHEEYNIVLSYSREMGYSDTTKSNLTNAENQLYNISANLEKINNKL